MRIKNLMSHIFLIICSILTLFPFLWLVIGATNTSTQITLGKITLGSNLFVNFASAIGKANVLLGLKNSLIIALVITTLVLMISSLAGYALVVFPDSKRELIFKIMLFSMMIPFAGQLIPLFKIFTKMKLLNTYAAAILPSISSVYLAFFFRQSFKAFPRELIEASRLDGLSEFGIFLKIVFPVMKSTYAAAGIVAFMGAWNSYMWPLIVLQSNRKMTLPMMAASISNGYSPDYGALMVILIIATLPMIIVFFALQRHFVQGMTGSIK
ncbi:MAG: carbohydrate ABC transporter permease [Cetobacterium sp.]|uniref:carbohydrate ABC transporter permease n=1 Tax=uncultured Cetobacterium sp. TaxID=527638 RepID=UPI0025DAD079|nr:carbohydrate ABC transporter permease [uncultured Cetobacterium sp.]